MDYIPGVPAAGHLANGWWHPGVSSTCPRCKAAEGFRRRMRAQRKMPTVQVPK